MPRAVATRAELELLMTAARTELCDCEDHDDTDGAFLARARCDALLDRWAHIPEQRG